MRWLLIRLRVCMNCHPWREDSDVFFLFFFPIHLYSGAYRAHAFHLQRDMNMISNSASYTACNYPESHWFILHPLRPDSPQIVYRYRYPGFDWILVVQTRLYYISYSSPFIHWVLSLLLGKICKAVEFDPPPRTNWDVLYLQCSAVGLSSSLEKPCCAD